MAVLLQDRTSKVSTQFLLWNNQPLQNTCLLLKKALYRTEPSKVSVPLRQNWSQRTKLCFLLSHQVMKDLQWNRSVTGIQIAATFLSKTEKLSRFLLAAITDYLHHHNQFYIHQRLSRVSTLFCTWCFTVKNGFLVIFNCLSNPWQLPKDNHD